MVQGEKHFDLIRGNWMAGNRADFEPAFRGEVPEQRRRWRQWPPLPSLVRPFGPSSYDLCADLIVELIAFAIQAEVPSN